MKKASFLVILLGLSLACTFTGTAYPTPAPTLVAVPTREPAAPGLFQIRVDDVRAGDTVVISLTVQASGPQALLFDTPTLDGEYPTPESLDRARLDLLNLATGGRAQISLEFPRPASGPPWLLVFNSLHTPENQVAPRVEVKIGE
jgi:hypothetical protein